MSVATPGSRRWNGRESGSPALARRSAAEYVCSGIMESIDGGETPSADSNGQAGRASE